MANPFTNTEQVNAVIKVRRGPEIERQQFQYEDGELIYSTDKKRMFVGDGTDTTGTLGGILIGNKTWYVDSFDKLPYIQKYDTVYRTDLKAEYVYYGNNYLLSSNYVLVGGLKLITDNVNISEYQLPNATTTVKGGVVVGSGLKASNGTLAIDFDPNAFTLNGNKITLLSLTPPPSNDGTYITKGILKVNDGSTGQGGIRVVNGSISVSIDNQTLKLNSGTNTIRVDPLIATIPATTSLIGGLILGAGLSSRTDTGLTNVNVDNNTIKINPANALYVDTTVIGGGGGGGGGGSSSFTLNDGSADLTGVNKLTIKDGLTLDGTGRLDLIAADSSNIGGVIPKGGLRVDASGNLSVSHDKSLETTGSGQLKVSLSGISIRSAFDLTGLGSQQISDLLINFGPATLNASGDATVTFKTPFGQVIGAIATHEATTGVAAVGATCTTTAITLKGPANASITFLALGVPV